MEEIVRNAVKYIRDRIDKTPEIAVILGSGLNDILDSLENKVIIQYEDIEGLPKTRAEGHKSQFVIGDIYGKTIIAMQGRYHLYDGFTQKQVVLPIYIFKELGVKTLIVTNAAGGVNKDYNTGDIMLLEDHINNTFRNCLIGGPIIDYGEMFIDMSEPYDPEYRNMVLDIAKENDIKIQKGTYIQFVGPFYETKADIKMISILGADAVGMSTVVEVEAARQCQLRVLGLGVITNKATGLGKDEQSHKDVLKNSKEASGNLIKIIKEFIKRI